MAGVLPRGSLRRRASRAVAWTATAAGFTGLIQMVQVVLLARWLGPVDFGLGSMMNAIVALGQLLADGGLAYAIVQRRDTTSEQLSTLYWFQMGLGVACGGALVGLTPVVVRYFRTPDLAPLLAIASVTFLIRPLGQIFLYLLQRDLAFDIVARIDVLATTGAAAAAVFAALAGAGARTFAVALLVGASVRAAFLAVTGWRRWPLHGRFRPSEVGTHLRMGWWRVGVSLASVATTHTDTILVGRVLGGEILGLYRVGADLALRSVYWINPIVTRVAFPLLTEAQGDPAVLRRGYLEMVRVLALALAPLLLGLAAVAHLAVPVLLGPGWAAAIPVTRAMAVLALLRALTIPVSGLLGARGRVPREFGWSLTVLGAAALVVGTAAATGSVLVVARAYTGLWAILFVLAYLWLVRPVAGVPSRPYIRACLVPVVAASAMAGVVTLTSRALDGWSPPVELAVLVALGMVVYGGAILIVDRRTILALAGSVIRR